MKMGKAQAISESVNKGIIIGFTVTTASAASTDVVTAAKVAEAGGISIRDIHLRCSDADGYLGLGKAAAVISSGAANVVQDIIPIFNGSFLNKENLNYAYLTVIRAGATNLTVTGYVVVN